MKRFISFALVVLLIVSLFPITASAATPSDIAITYSKTLSAGQKLGGVDFSVSGTGVCENGKSNGNEWSNPTQLFCWYKTGSAEMLGSDTIAETGQSYYPCIYVCLAAEYEADGDVTVRVNGKSVTAAGFGDGIYVNCPAIAPDKESPPKATPTATPKATPTATPKATPTATPTQPVAPRPGTAIVIEDLKDMPTGQMTDLAFIVCDENASVTAQNSCVRVDDPVHFKIDGLYATSPDRVNVVKNILSAHSNEYDGKLLYFPPNGIRVGRNSDEHGTFSTTLTFTSLEGEFYTCELSYTYPEPQEQLVSLEYDGVLLEFLSGVTNWILVVDELKPETGMGKRLYDVIALDNLAEIITIYDIHVTSESSEKTDGEFTIKIPLKNGLENWNSFRFMYVEESGNDFKSGTSVKAEIEGDYIVARLPRLSIYALLGSNEAEPGPAGPGLGWIIGLAIAAAAAAAVVVIAVVRSKKSAKKS